MGVYLLTPGDRSVLVRQGDLEAGLILGGTGAPGEGSAPLVDMNPPASLHSRQPSDLYSQGRSDDLVSLNSAPPPPLAPQHILFGFAASSLTVR